MPTTPRRTLAELRASVRNCMACGHTGHGAADCPTYGHDAALLRTLAKDPRVVLLETAINEVFWLASAHQSGSYDDCAGRLERISAICNTVLPRVVERDWSEAELAEARGHQYDGGYHP